MKTFLILISILFGTLCAKAQTVIQKKILVTTNKTTFLMFPNDISFFDVGSLEIGAEITDNKRILRVKAVKTGLKETNLTVVCSGDQLYSFIINYSANPDTLNYILKGKSIIAHKTKADEIGEPTSSAKEYSEDIKNVLGAAKGQTMVAGAKNEGIIMALKGIYVKDNLLYFAIEVGNLSKINYDINFVKFLIKDKKKLRQSSLQETEQIPLQSYPELTTLTSSKPIEMVFVFNKFTVPSAKKLVIDMWDKSGERNISVEINGSDIFKAKILR